MYRSTESVREMRVAAERALAVEPSPYHRIRAAQAAAVMGDLRAVEQKLAGIDDELPELAPPLRDFAAGAVGELGLRLHRPAEALAALDRAAALDGDGQVARARALVELHRFDEAVEQLDRTLAAATPGGAIGQMQLWTLYEALGELVHSRAEAQRLAELVEAHAREGFSTEPRERVLAMLYDRAGVPDRVIEHARRADASGAIDVQLDLVQLHAVTALHRDDEALALQRRLRRWQPNEPVEAVISPLVAAPDRPRDSP
jgi:tetratricopeptide (TPR) repeat protein